MPTAPVNKMNAPESKPNTRTAWRSANAASPYPASYAFLLGQAFAQDALRAEDQHEHQHGKGDDVFELVRARDAQPGETRFGPMASITPRNKPPSIAPGILPMPPSTAAVKALMPGMKPMKKLTPWGRNTPLITPAEPAKKPPTPKVNMITQVDVDAHQAGDFLVLRNGAHRLANARALHQPIQAQASAPAPSRTQISAPSGC